MRSTDKKIKNIIVNYDNGETEIIDKGIAIGFEKNSEAEVDVIQYMCNIKDNDLSAEILDMLVD